ncbi:Type II toxin-antitoxin system HigB family toxin [Gammaproteobacteria bacterium]
MRHLTSSRFWQCFGALPADVQGLARRNYALLKQNPVHPSLRFKEVCRGRYRSIRVGIHYRALGVPVPLGIQWFWIGRHDEYEQWLDQG